MYEFHKWSHAFRKKNNEFQKSKVKILKGFNQYTKIGGGVLQIRDSCGFLMQ